MRKMYVLVLVVVAIVISQGVYAACTDSDGGPLSNFKDIGKFLLTPGVTVDSFKTYKDVCVRNELSDKKVDHGEWLREYYCDNGLAKHKDFKCSDYEFEECVTDDKGSYCKSNKPVAASSSSSSSSSSSASKKPLADFYCGTKVMARADAECFPPGKLCVKDKLPGQCNSNCKCVLVGKSAEKEAEKVVDKSSAAETAAEKPAAAKTAHKEIASESQKTESAPSSSVPEASKEKTQESSESPIKQTITLRAIAAIASGARKIWGSIAGLF